MIDCISKIIKFGCLGLVFFLTFVLSLLFCFFFKKKLSDKNNCDDFGFFHCVELHFKIQSLTSV